MSTEQVACVQFQPMASVSKTHPTYSVASTYVREIAVSHKVHWSYEWSADFCSNEKDMKN